ncbi:MAG TPA: serine hydrolase [Candidatus Sulfotelmatobacter sp.]|nr:serine hydrolase [Candidatus Sulfotelmatobacter sp.]
MRRGPFLGMLGAAALAPRRAFAAPELALDGLIAGIPGITGVYARTLAAGPPAASWRAGEQFPAASVIKLAIMATVYRAYDAGTARPTDLVRTRADDLIGGSDVLAGSQPGAAWSLDTLVKAMIRVSDNAAANTLITQFGMSTINHTMRLAGMRDSKLARHFADVVPAWKRNLNVVTPRDVARLLFSLEHGTREGERTIATPQSCRAMIEVMLGNDDATKIVRGLPPGTPCAHKTGELDGTRNDAAIVDPFGDAPYVLVVLTRDLTDYTAGNAGIAAIARRVDAALRTS